MKTTDETLTTPQGYRSAAPAISSAIARCMADEAAKQSTRTIPEPERQPTLALSVMGLASHMKDYAACAFDTDLRYSNDTDAVLLGKLTMLDVICEGIWMCGVPMTPAEESALSAAKRDLDRAWNHLSAAVEKAA